MSARRGARVFVPVRLRTRRAERRWETLAWDAGIDDQCDARLCAKMAKSRKLGRRTERRLAKRLLRDAAAV